MARKTILIIDTDREVMQNMISMLESADYLVFGASNKNDSVNVARKVNPSLIFINIGMSGASGLDISKTIHDDETLKNIPVVILTPHGGTVEPRYTSIYGIIDFLKTSCSPEELITKTQDILSKTTAQEEPAGGIPEQTAGQIAVEHNSLEKEPQEQPVEEAVTAHPVREEIEAQLAEELMETGKTETKPAEETGPAIIKEDAEEFLSGLTDKDVLEQKLAEKEPEEAEPAAHTQTEEVFPDSSLQADDSRSHFTEEKIERSKKTRTFFPVFILILILLSVAGILLYRNVWHGQKTDTPVTVRRSIPAEKQAAEVQPPQEQQKPRAVQAVKPASIPPPSVAKALPKSGYAVQIGAFTNRQNALSITKKYQEKGYSPHVYKSKPKDKGILYRVLIGNFHDRKEAVRLADKIRSEENIDAMVYQQPVSQ